MIDVGSPFPEFTLADESGAEISLATLKGSKAVIYFYPKDDTSGCTIEACEFRDALPSIAGVRVIGVSPDSSKSHAKFIGKFNLNFTLLADTDHVLCEAAGVWAEKSMYGKKYMGVERTTFVLDEQGVVQHVFRKVKPQGHADEVIAVLSGR